MKVDQQYDPVEIESQWYDFWVDGGFFKADEHSDKEPYTIVIPPPNVTGSLHMGHALFVTLQDILIRWKRMQGYETLWLPGTDHAGIATQVVDDHLGAVLGQHQGVFPADATTGTGHDGHAACTDVAHLMFSWMWMRGGRGPLRG